jgi:hypothetical protein
MSKRQISKIYPGTSFKNRRFSEAKDKLIKKSAKCIACGSRKNLEPHHIIPCHVYDELFLDENNLALLCTSCHNRYHQTCFPINRKTFEEFCRKKHRPKAEKKKRRYTQKKYEPHPLYSKIKINDFRKKQPKNRRKRKRRKKKLKRYNPIYLVKNLGTDYWSYLDKIEIEKEVLGDFYEG